MGTICGAVQKPCQTTGALVQRGPWNLPLLPSEISCSKSQVVGRRRGCAESLIAPRGLQAMLVWVLATGRSCLHLGSPGYIHTPSKSSWSFSPASHWLLASGCWGFGVLSLALACRSLPWHRHNGQGMDFAPSNLFPINTSCIYCSEEFRV